MFKTLEEVAKEKHISDNRREDFYEFVVECCDTFPNPANAGGDYTRIVETGDKLNLIIYEFFQPVRIRKRSTEEWLKYKGEVGDSIVDYLLDIIDDTVAYAKADGVTDQKTVNPVRYPFNDEWMTDALLDSFKSLVSERLAEKIQLRNE